MAVKHGIDTANIPEEFKGAKAIRQRSAEERYRIFSHYYVHNGLNALQAAISTGYSEDSAGAQAHELLNIPYVQDWINKLQEDKKAASVVTFDWVMKNIVEIEALARDAKDYSSALKAEKQLAEMQGYDAPSKHLVMPVEDKDESKAEAYLAQFRRDE